MKNQVTEKLIAAVKKKAALNSSKDEIAFLRNFYHRLSGQDFVADKALEFRDTALRHQKLGEIRAPGKTLIEAYNLGEKEKENQSGDGQLATVINIITDDKPFLIDSLTIKLNALHKTPQRTTHPNFEVQRDSQHRIIHSARSKGGQAHSDCVVESYVQFVIDFTPRNEHKPLLRELRHVIADIEIVVKDWKEMRAHALSLAGQIENHQLPSNKTEHGELLRWMENHNFAFLGYAEIDISDSSTHKISVDEKSLLGVLRAAHRHDPDMVMDILPPILPKLAGRETSPMMFTKSRQRSTIHRTNYLDCILIDHSFLHNETDTANQSARPRPNRISCILGFLAGTSAMLPTSAIPYLSGKTKYILKESTLRPGGYSYKALHAIIETLPREKLFQMASRSLYKLCMTVLNHLERRKTRVHLHRNICGHFYSCLVYVPRDLFNSTLRERIQEYMSEYFSASEVSFNVYFSDSILTRIHYLIHCHENVVSEVDAAKFENAIQAIARDWNENLHEFFRQHNGHEIARDMMERYRDAFPSNYQDDFSIEQAVIDIDRLENLKSGEIYAALTRQSYDETHQRASFKLYSNDGSLALSDVLPILENMGIRVLAERPYPIHRQDNTECWLHDFDIVWPHQPQSDEDFSVEKFSVESFQSTFRQAWYGKIENDGFNQLTLLAGLGWKQINLLRTCYRYLKQIRLHYSEQYIIDALCNNPELVTCIVKFFDTRFNPALQDVSVRKIKSTIQRQLAQVATLDEERIINALMDVINATLRTNYYQSTESGNSKPCLALKLAPETIPHIPAPAPSFEIFVCSPKIEGVHLRGGPVARGGLRWSDRHEDFRTEVLGLVKAQRVKNAVIVPVGSKGGFVVKQLPETDRNAINQEVIACYQLFISSMLDLTDNVVDGQVVPPKDVVRMDGDDPYLVVAADKGTATFSDIANDLSEDYGYWLGDAFASGGSAGYDHKKMGITAKGAWESVKRHFRELGKDIQSTDFTVAGIGDMAGDVFGNGMLLSKHIRLVAAFNHMHIFIDPDPDAASSYQERKRLFALPRSSWSDYDQKLISRGGDIFERSAKSITLSPQAKKALGTSKDKHTPDQLINIILKADVELLWNGGIGTYVKATTETHETVQDKNNDEVRVDANQLLCKVVGEGGNLGMTQLARIEYSLGGGRCYNDAIDNSAGVDTSDHEVNIKILLNSAVQNKLIAENQRNAILAKMEDEVGALVLANNYMQTQVLSREAARSSRIMPQQRRAIDMLEQKGLLNREIEFLPDNASLDERREQEKWLTRPELAVLLSYSKMDMYQALLASDVPDNDYLAVEIDRYFPPLLASKYPTMVRSHQLKREIISTQITNHLIGTMGPSFHLRLAYLSNNETTEIVRAYLAARELLDMQALMDAINSLDTKIDANLQMKMLGRAATSMRQCIVWLLRNCTEPLDIQEVVSSFKSGCKQLTMILKKPLGNDLSENLSKHSQKLQEQGTPADIATQIAMLPLLGYAVDIVDLSKQCKRSLEQTATLYFKVRETFALDWIEESINSLPLNNDWHERARFSLGNDLRASHSVITSKVMASPGKASTDEMLESWLQANQHPIQNIEKMTASLKTESAPDFAMLSVLLSELAWLH